MTGRPWTEEEIETVKTMRSQGYTVKEMADAVHHGKSTVQALLSKLGLTEKRRPAQFGLENKRIVKAFKNMHSRCENPNVSKFKNHGGRGIKVCEEWSNDEGLRNFYNWAINNGYEDNLTLDRIDNDGNYEPSNCRWADYATQNRNFRRNRMVTIDGETKCVADWCNEYGISDSGFYNRLESGLTGRDLIAPPKIYPGSGTGFVGVYQRESGSYRANISKDNVHYNLGTYKDIVDAVKVRLDAELKLYGHYISDIEDVEKKLRKIIEDRNKKER